MLCKNQYQYKGSRIFVCFFVFYFIFLYCYYTVLKPTQKLNIANRVGGLVSGQKIHYQYKVSRIIIIIIIFYSVLKPHINVLVARLACWVGFS